ncbi:MAG: PGPGW domain-containing protein [Elusimicrobia bacterium]|nr:PGPGW domain-containing protein [Elusimicrobiota bacterium]
MTITAGAALVVVGIVMIPLPGPGMLLVLVGLAMLAKYYPWAKQMLRSVKRKVVAATKSLRKYLRARRLAKIRERREKE